MARLFTCGYETGAIGEDAALYASSIGTATASVVTSTPTPRSGSYCVKFNMGTSGAHYTLRKYDLGSGIGEIYGRLPFYPSLLVTNYALAFLRFYDSANGEQLYLTITRSDGLLRLYRGSALAGTLLATASIAAKLDQWNTLEFRATPLDAGGVFQLWLNDVLVIDFSGDTQATANANIRYVEWGIIQSAGQVGLYMAFDDIAINDTSGAYQTGRTGDAAVLYLGPNGNGNSSQLVGSDGNSVDNYLLVDEVPPASADYVGSNVVDNEDTYALANVPSPYTGVTLVQAIAWAALAAAGSGNLRLVVRSNSVDYPDAADKVLTTVYLPIKGDVLYIDPNDSAAWTTPKVNSLEAGPRVR